MSWKNPFSLVIDGELLNGDLRYDTGEEYATFESGDRSWFIAKDSETAGEYVADRWREMAENDPKEFRMLVGDENLIQWALGKSAGPGSNHYRSLDAWLESWKDHPAEDLASYDGNECDVTAPESTKAADEGNADSGETDEDSEDEDSDNEDRILWEQGIEELGWTPTVAYRQN